jgi:hypothetical protein
MAKLVDTLMELDEQQLRHAVELIRAQAFPHSVLPDSTGNTPAENRKRRPDSDGVQADDGEA